MKKITQSILGDILGISRSAIGNKFNRDSFKEEEIVIICKEFNINLNWVYQGEEPIFLTDVVHEQDPGYYVTKNSDEDRDNLKSLYIEQAESLRKSHNLLIDQLTKCESKYESVKRELEEAKRLIKEFSAKQKKS